MNRGIGIILGSVAAASSLAAPTGLIVIPIADILRHRELSGNHAITG